MEDQANPQGATIESAMDRIGALYNEDQPQIEEPKEETTEEVQEETESSDESTEVEDSGEDVGEEVEPQEATEEESEAERFERLSELAEATGMSLEDFMANVKGTVKVNGVEQEVPLAELQKGYQMEADYRRKTSELSEQRKAFEAEREQVATELGARYQEAQQISEYMEQQLMGEYNSIDWASIRSESPADYAALKQDYNDRYSQIQQIKANVADELQKQSEEQQRKQLEEGMTHLQKEQELLTQIIPEFGDENKAAEIKGQMRDFLKGNGFSDEEIGGIYDHRQVLLIRDAMAYRDLKSKGVSVKNKVTKAPKLQKPGKKSATTEQVTDKKLRSRLKKTGSIEDAMKLIKL